MPARVLAADMLSRVASQRDLTTRVRRMRMVQPIPSRVTSQITGTAGGGLPLVVMAGFTERRPAAVTQATANTH